MARYTMPRYIPEGAEEIKGEGVVVYCYENRRGQPSAICYGGKRSQPDWNYCYTTTKARDERVRETLAAYAERAARKAAEREAKKKLENPLKVGDLLSASWGYEQTNVDYYQVVKATKKTVVLREIAARSVEATGWASDRCAPDKDNFVGKPMTRRVRMYQERDGSVSCSVKVRECARAYPCSEDSTTYRSWYG